MSNLEVDPRESVTAGAAIALEPVHELLPGVRVQLGPRGMEVTRTLPSRGRRMVGAWCFLDHFGPEQVNGDYGMRVPPHPHTCLQTVTWLLRGEVLHRDTLGSQQLIRPGELNLMTAGRGIAHAEESPADHGPLLHGVQLWVALPDAERQVAPHFEHHADLPVARLPGADVTVLLGALADALSPAQAYSPIIGAQLALQAGSRLRLPLRPDFEHAVLALSGTAQVDGQPLQPGPLLYLGCGRDDLMVHAEADAVLLLIGGEPFQEQLVMWWNFVGRSHDEVVRFREAWNDGGRGFGEVQGYQGEPLPAPPLPSTPLKPRGRQR